MTEVAMFAVLVVRANELVVAVMVVVAACNPVVVVVAVTCLQLQDEQPAALTVETDTEPGLHRQVCGGLQGFCVAVAIGVVGAVAGTDGLVVFAVAT